MKRILITVRIILNRIPLTNLNKMKKIVPFIVLDDTLQFIIEDIKIKTDTAGMIGMGKWSIFCIVDSLTVNGTRIKSIFTDAIYPPVSLMKSYKNRHMMVWSVINLMEL